MKSAVSSGLTTHSSLHMPLRHDAPPTLMKNAVSSGLATHSTLHMSRVAVSLPLVVKRSPTCRVCLHGKPERCQLVETENHLDICAAKQSRRANVNSPLFSSPPALAGLQAHAGRHMYPEEMSIAPTLTSTHLPTVLPPPPTVSLQPTTPPPIAPRTPEP